MTEVQIPEAWRGHYLAGERRLDGDDVIVVDPRCGSCGAVPGTDDWPQAWFATHLQEQGAADYAVGFERSWRKLVTDPDGALDADKVARELADYSDVMAEASKVYEELAGFSKPNTAARHVIQGAEDRFAETYADNLLDAAKDTGPEGLTRDELIALAETWHPGALEAFEKGQAWIAEINAKRAEASG